MTDQRPLHGYAVHAPWDRHRLWAGGVLAAFATLYGTAIAMFSQSLLLQLTIPLVVLLALVIWALPDTGRAPIRWIEWLLFTFLFALMAWPDYMAFAAPGLPWITAIRLVGVPLAIVLLISLSLSSAFRSQWREILDATPWTWRLVLAFVGISAVSIAFSAEPSFSLSKFIIAQLYWTAIFFASAWVFARPGRATALAWLLWGMTIFVCLIGLLEWRRQELPWIGHVPSFLKIEDPVVEHILEAKARSTTGIYRVQSKFTTPLGFAEFMTFTTPVVIYFMLRAKRWYLQIAAAATLVLIFQSVISTDSRLGVVGFFLACLFSILAWAATRWKQVEDSLFGPAVTLAFPAMFVGFIVATFTVGRLRAMVWGTKAQSFSTQAREDQVASGLPMILSQPWGRGIGRGAYELGYTNMAGTLTIDTYYLLIGLEFGVIGFLTFFAIFGMQLIYASRHAFLAETDELRLIAPFAIALVNFVVIKAIFAQQENHPLIFALLGALTALVYRVQSQHTVQQIPAGEARK